MLGLFEFYKLNNGSELHFVSTIHHYKKDPGSCFPIHVGNPMMARGDNEKLDDVGMRHQLNAIPRRLIT